MNLMAFSCARIWSNCGMVVMSKNIAISRLSFRWDLARPPDVPTPRRRGGGLGRGRLGRGGNALLQLLGPVFLVGHRRQQIVGKLLELE